MRGASRCQRTASGALLVAIVTALAVGCTVGPAANRAARMAPPADPPGQETDTPDPSEDPDDDWLNPTEDPTTPPTPETYPKAENEGTIDDVASVADGLSIPCCVAELPGGDGDVLVGEADTGTIYRVDEATGEPTEVGAVTGLSSEDGSGLLGLAAQASPLEGEGVVNVAVFVAGSGSSRIGTYRYVLDPPAGQSAWGGAETTLVDGITDAAIGNGGALAYGPDEVLYASTGDEILRVESSSYTDPEEHLLSSDHTNVQGLAWDPAGRLWVLDAGDGTAETPASLSKIDLDPQDGTFGLPIEVWSANDDLTSQPTGLAYGEDSRSLWMTTDTDEGIWRIPLDGEGDLVTAPTLLPDPDMADAAVQDLIPGADANTLLALTADGRVLQLTVT